MKKLLVLTLALVLTLSVGYVTMASTIGIGATEGLTVELYKQIDPSVDPVTITGYYGLNEQLQLSLGYTTKDKKNNDDAYLTLGARYAFVENIAVYFEYNDYEKEPGTKFGLRGKYSVSDQLALVGDLNFNKIDDYDWTEIKGQAEYGFNDMVVGNIGFKYSKDDNDSATDIIAGIEVYPIEQVYAFLDYTIVDTKGADDTIEFGIGYSF